MAEEEKSTILYIDDEMMNLTGFRFVFRTSYNVLIADTIAQAEEILAQNPVKVIISDQKMPEMSGSDFLKSISEKYPDIIKIILTAYADSGTAIDAINEINIYQFIIKPWKKEKMEETLRNAVEIFDLTRKNSQLIENLRSQNEKIQIANDLLTEEINTRKQAERALKQSEQKFKRIFNSSSEGIFIWNSQFKIIDVNKAVLNVLGYEKEEILSLSIFDAITEEYYEQIRQHSRILLSGKTQQSYEIEGIAKDGTIIPIEVNSRVIQIADKVYILTLIHDLRERKQKEQIILNATIETEERERQRFAQDLHDDFGPTLSSAKMYLQLLKEKEQDARSSEIIDTVQALIEESIDNIRSTSNALSSHILVQYGLAEAIKNTVEKFRAFVSVSLDTNLRGERFLPNTEAIVYRILNELLNNTIKHADATRIDIGIYIKKQNLKLSYVDNGKGFDLQQKLADAKGGIGIFNILNRIQTIGGKYTFDTSPGNGVVFALKVKAEKMSDDTQRFMHLHK